MNIKCAHTEVVDLHKLQPHPKNPNKHPEKQISMLAKIIDYQGMRNPIVVSKRSGFITKGHGRLEALQKLGWAQAPVDYQDYDNEAQEYADIVADNKIAELAQHDDSMMIDEIKELDITDFELLGLDDFDIPLEPDEAKEEIEDDVPTNVDTRCKPGDLWILGEHRLLCGDATNIQHVEKLMGGEKADMVFTDPPYGVSVKNTQGTISGDESLDVFEASLPMLKVSMKDNAHYYVWCASGDMFPPSIDVFSSVFDFQNILPIRCTHENKRGKKGAFKLNFETCLFGNNNERGFNPSDKFKVSDTTLKDNRYHGDGNLRVYPALWDGERSTEHNMNIVHPTQKKVEMIEFYIDISSKKNEGVLDLFGGSGSTLIACEKTKRKCYMMELDPHYCDVILSRYEKYSDKEAKLWQDSQQSTDQNTVSN